MKLTTFILIIALAQVSAATFGQKLTFSKKGANLEEVFMAIKAQTGYNVLYSTEAINDREKVDVVFVNTDLHEVLKELAKNRNFQFSIQNKTISIKPRELSVLDRIASVFARIDIRGKVVGEDNQGLPGASIKVIGSDRTSSTDKNGFFTLKGVASDARLEISYIGYQTKTVAVSADMGTIVLEISNNKLQEVVVSTGYQNIKKEKLTGSVVTVTADELEKRYTPNILDNLEGRAPGLVNYKGSAIVRGIGTFNNGIRNPLYVVDGLPIEGSVANINPYDVETVTVLKDAAAAAIYGVRASNGVIVITTKKAKRPGTTLEFATDLTIMDKIDYSRFNNVTPAQQVDIESETANWYFTNPTNGAANVTGFATQINNGYPITPIMYLYYQYAQNQISKTQLDQTLAGYRQNNFAKEYEDHALLNQTVQQYNLALRNSGEKFQSSLILNYKTDNKGIINAYYRQLNLFYKGSYKPFNWLNIDFGVNSILGKIKESNSNFAISGLNVPSYMRLLDDNGNRLYYTTGDYNSYNTLNNATTPQLQSMLVNHLEELERDSKQTRQNFGRYFVNLRANILPGLSFSPQFQYENNITRVRTYSEAESYAMRYLRNIFTTRTGTAPNYTYNYLIPQGGRLLTTDDGVDAWTARGQFDYNKQIDKHEVSVIAGTEFRENLSKGTRGLLLGYSDQLQSQNTNTVNFQAINAYTNSTFFKPGPTSFGATLLDQLGLIQEARQRYNSLYANATYTYDRKYNVFGSYRRDYADVFGLDAKYRGRPLWSAGVSWNVNNEDFMKDFNWIDFLKVRATYGITGNVPQSLSSRLVANSALPVNPSTQLPVSVVENAGNPALTWEKTASTNLGLDFSLFNGRLNGTFDWYHKAGSDIFSSTRIDPSKGFLSQIINNGDVLNTGIELNLQYQWFRPAGREDFGWSSSFVISKNKNRVTYVDQVANTPTLLTNGGLKEGYPVQSLFSYRFGGLNSTGQPQWYKANGTLTTAQLTNDDLSAMVFSGGLDPKINVTLFNEFSYKGFSLNVLAVYYGGHYQRVPRFAGLGSSYGAIPIQTLDAWTPTHTNTYVMPYGQYQASGTVTSVQNFNSDVFVQPGDFIKIRSVGLSYRLPKELSMKLGSNNIQLRFQLNNPKPLWIKNKVNVDPEANVPAPSPGVVAPFINTATVNPPYVLTSYVFGLNFNF